MYWLILLIAVLSGIALVYYYIFYEEEINEKALYILLLCFVLSSLSSYINSKSFDEVSINDYELVIDSKEKCIKYTNCEEELKNILEDGKIREYELSKYKEILEKEIGEEKAREEWKKELDRDMKNKEKLEQIKKELELKKGN